MFDAINKTFKDGTDIANLEVLIYSRKHNNIPENTIVDTYFRFCEKQTEIMKKYKRTREAARILVEECIQEGIFADYFEENKEEVMTNVEAVFNQARETERFGEERYQAGIEVGREIGIKEGITKGRKEQASESYAKGIKDQANKMYAKALELNIPEEVAREIAGLNE